MWRLTLLVLALTLPQPTTMTDLTLLTRDGCVNTPEMRVNLDDALRSLGWRRDYHVVNISELKATDVRTGYPTPTLLWKGKDIFGMPVPKPPYGTPS